MPFGWICIFHTDVFWEKWMRRVKVHDIPPLPSLHTRAESLEIPAVLPPLMLAQHPEESKLSPLACGQTWGLGIPPLTPSYGCAADWTQCELASEHNCIRIISLIMSLCQASFPVVAKRFYMHQGYYFCQPIQELKIWKPGYLREANLLCILNLSTAVVLSSTF